MSLFKPLQERSREHHRSEDSYVDPNANLERAIEMSAALDRRRSLTL
jgi:hypothetical protein